MVLHNPWICGGQSHVFFHISGVSSTRVARNFPITKSTVSGWWPQWIHSMLQYSGDTWPESPTPTFICGRLPSKNTPHQANNITPKMVFNRPPPSPVVRECFTRPNVTGVTWGVGGSSTWVTLFNRFRVFLRGCRPFFGDIDMGRGGGRCHLSTVTCCEASLTNIRCCETFSTCQ